MVNAVAPKPNRIAGECCYPVQETGRVPLGGGDYGGQSFGRIG